MAIRQATLNDTESLKNLLDQLDYPGTQDFLAKRMNDILINPNSELLVYEDNGIVVAFIQLDFIPQLALKGDFARISYFAVDATIRSKGIGKEIEEHCMQLAQKRNCDRIELHCNEKRKEAHRFYYRQGYVESPKYLMKSLV